MLKNIFVTKPVKYEERSAKHPDPSEKIKIVEVVVGMATCGIAAGSRDVLRAILMDAEENRMNNLVILSGGCIGHCECEPIVLVRYSNEPFTVYKNVTPALAAQIMDEHVRNGKVLAEHTLFIDNSLPPNQNLRR